MTPRMRTTFVFPVLFTTAVLLASPLAYSQGTTSFSDNFDTYLPGPLSGQGDWTGYSDYANICVSNASHFAPSMAIDGRQTSNPSAVPIGDHLLPVPVSPTGITTFSADAYASSAYTESTQVCLAHLTDTGYDFQVGWWVNRIVGPQAWYFFLGTELTPTGYQFPGCLDEVTHIETIIDASNNTVYGRLTCSSGIHQTPRYPISASSISSLTHIFIGQYFYSGGTDLDNLQVTTEPPVPSLFCSPAGFLPPFDVPIALKKKQDRAIPIKMTLKNSIEQVVTDASIASPVVNIEFTPNGSTDAVNVTSQLLPLGSANDDNIFRFDPPTSKWIYNLGTKFFGAPGMYRVKALPGNTDYNIDGSCSGTFVRLP
jgi:hypothetical protein